MIIPLNHLRSFVVTIFFLLTGTFNMKLHAELRVGAILPLSGMAQEFGDAVKNGIELARAEHPEHFTNVTFIYEDSRYDSKLSLSAANKLITVDKVDLILAWGNTPAITIAPLTERARIPTISVLTEYEEVKDLNYTVRFINSNDQYAEALLKYFRERKYNRIAIALCDQSYYQTYYLGIKNNLQNGESATLLNTYLPGVMDFKDAALKIKQGNYDTVGLFLNPGQISTMARQMQAIGIHGIPVFGADDFESNTEVKDSNGMLEGGVYAGNSFNDAFKNRYRKKYKNDIHLFYAANAYDFAELTAELATSERAYTKESILKHFTATGLHKGATGEFAFRKDPVRGKYYDFPIVVKKIVGTDREVVYPK